MEAFPAIPADNMEYYDFPQRFEGFIKENRERPVLERSPCRDSVCLVILLIAIGGFFGYGGYIINQASTNELLYSGWLFHISTIKSPIGYTLAMVALSLGLSIAMLILLRFAPVVGIWIMVVVSLCSIAAMTVVCYYYNLVPTAIILSVMLAVLVLMAICYSQKITSMGDILRTVSMFLQERKKIFVITFTILMVALGFVAFWVVSYYSMLALAQLNVISENQYTTGFVFWILLGIFWNFWFYYAMVYLVGAETALWFYESSLTPIFTPLKWLLRGSLGSVTFGSMMLVLIKGVDIILSLSLKGRKDRQQSIANAVFRCCVCMLQCCLRSLFTYVKILNNYNMIVISMTGESYLDSAKLTGYLILSNFDMFDRFKLTSYFVYIGGLTISSGIPTFIGLYLMHMDGMVYYQLVIYGAIIFFLSFLIGIVVYTTLMESVNAMFVLYCFETSATQFGQRIDRVQPRHNQLAQEYRQSLPQDLHSFHQGTKAPT